MNFNPIVCNAVWCHCHCVHVWVLRVDHYAPRVYGPPCACSWVSFLWNREGDQRLKHSLAVVCLIADLRRLSRVTCHCSFAGVSRCVCVSCVHVLRARLCVYLYVCAVLHEFHFGGTGRGAGGLGHRALDRARVVCDRWSCGGRVCMNAACHCVISFCFGGSFDWDDTRRHC